MRRREFVGLALSGAGCSRKRPATPTARGIAWLLDHQADDGGWHSETYGLLRSGQSLTPFVLEALLTARADAPVERAIDFLRKHTRDGLIGMASDTPDYPNYATALAVKAMVLAGRRDEARPLVEALRRQQLIEPLGWKPSDAAYGAWGIGGAARTAPFAGHVDLSMTRHVIEALAAAGGPDDALAKARIFVDRCRGRDNGFHFSTVVNDANKAGSDRAGYRSYGTATADGILAFRAIGATDSAATVWLRKNHAAGSAPGFDGEAYARWPAGLRYYYAAVSSEVIGCTPAMAGALARRQRPDGSWANEEPLVKEDDPLIATAFAVRALARC